MYILVEGSIDTFLSLHDEDLVLDNIKMSGSILGQYTVITHSNIKYSARATSETNMLVIPIDIINKLRADNPELNQRIKSIIQQTSEKGLPLLDYNSLRNKNKISMLAEQNQFNGRKVFVEAYQKWRKIFKHQRKKEFKFADMVKYMQKNKTISEEEVKTNHAKELFSIIRPVLQQKIEKLVTSRVEKLH